MVTDLKEIASAVKSEMTDAYRKAADQFKTDGDFDVMQAAFAELDAKGADIVKNRAEKVAETERVEREGRDKARDEYGANLAKLFSGIWTSQLAAALKKIAETNPALRFASIQIDIVRTTEGEGEAAKAVTTLSDPKPIMSLSSGAIGGSGGAGKGRRGLEVVVAINGTNHTYQSVNAAAQAILGATNNTNKETLVTAVNEKADHKVVSVGGKSV